MTEKDLEIQNLKIELKKAKKKLNYINKFIYEIDDRNSLKLQLVKQNIKKIIGDINESK